MLDSLLLMRLLFPAFFLLSLWAGCSPVRAQSAPGKGTGELVVAGICTPGPAAGPEGEPTAVTWGNGKREVWVASNSFLGGCALMLPSAARLRALKSEMRNVSVSIESGGMVDLSRTLVADFQLRGGPQRATSPAIAGMSGIGSVFSALDCLITGRLELGGATPLGIPGREPSGGVVTARIHGTHFVKAELVLSNDGPMPGLLLNRCHFEKCEVPLSWVIRSTECTYEDCRFKADIPKGTVPPGFTISIVGDAGTDGGLFANFGIKVKTVSAAVVRFWSPWQEAENGTVVTEHVIGLGPVRTEPCSPAPATEMASTMVRKVEGASFRARGMPKRVSFQQGKAILLTKGSIRNSSAVTLQNGGKVSWQEEGQEITGWFSGDYSVLVVGSGVVYERDNPAPSGGAPEGEEGIVGEEFAAWLTGTTWEFSGRTGQSWLRFECPGYCAWVNGDGTAGAGNAHPVRKTPGIFVKDWPAGKAGTPLSWDAQGKTLTYLEEGTAVTGTQLDRENPGVLAALAKGGIAPAGSQPAEAPPSDPAGQDPHPPVVLKAKTSEIFALQSRSEAGTNRAGPGVACKLSVLTVPSPGGFEATLQFPFFKTMVRLQPQIRTAMLARHQVWPASMDITFTRQGGGAELMDGLAISLPAALCMEGLYTGVVWAPDFCAAGELMADGSLQRVSGLPEKLAGATTLRCRIAGVPLENETEVRDYLLLKGAAALTTLQIIGLETLDDAVALARADRQGKTAAAVTEFSKITAIAPAPAALPAWLKTAPVIAQLKKVLDAEPRHLSAKLLLGQALGKPPAYLSLEISGEILARETTALWVRKFDPFDPAPVNPAAWSTMITALKRLRPLTHPDLKPLLDRTLGYAERRLKTPAKSSFSKTSIEAENKLIEETNRLSTELGKLDTGGRHVENY